MGICSGHFRLPQDRKREREAEFGTQCIVDAGSVIHHDPGRAMLVIGENDVRKLAPAIHEGTLRVHSWVAAFWGFRHSISRGIGYFRSGGGAMRTCPEQRDINIVKKNAQFFCVRPNENFQSCSCNYIHAFYWWYLMRSFHLLRWNKDASFTYLRKVFVFSIFFRCSPSQSSFPFVQLCAQATCTTLNDSIKKTYFHSLQGKGR